MTTDATTGGPLGLDPELLAILACPDTHHSPLTVDEAAGELLCTTCDRAFPVRNGIPVLLLDEACRRGGGAGGEHGTA
nr:Trm112 family protein [Candidatus Blastococcus massiliensis]